MIIRPNRDKADEFVIYLGSQELKNILVGIRVCHGTDGSPWSKGTCQQIEQALVDQYAYLNKEWK